MLKLVTTASILLVISLSGCDKPKIQDDANDISAIQALSSMRAKAFNEGRADDIAVAFTKSGLLMAPDMRSMKGRDAVRRYYQRIFDEYSTVLESGYDDVKVSGNMAYGVGFAKVKLVPHKGGDTLVSTAKYINILQRQDDGSWLTTHDIWNANEPPASN
jgi:uncharacterized protein (TIGR02246 family)